MLRKAIAWLDEFDPFKQPFRWFLRRLTVYAAAGLIGALATVLYAFVWSLLR